MTSPLERDLAEALRLDPDGRVHDRLAELAGWAQQTSLKARFDPASAELADALLRVVDDLSALLHPVPPAPAPLPPPGPAPEPAGGAAVLEEPVPEEPGPPPGAEWFPTVLKELHTRSKGRLAVAAADPAEAWAQLHLGCYWLDEETARECRDLLLRTMPHIPEGDWLVPPHPELGPSPGLSLADARRHPDVLQKVQGWSQALQTRYQRLIELVSLVLTFVEQADGLYGVRDRTIQPLDRAAYRTLLLQRLDNLERQASHTKYEIESIFLLDKALRMVFPRPFPAETSAWSRMLAESQELCTDILEATTRNPVIVLVDRGISDSSDAYRSFVARESPVQVRSSPEDYNKVLWPLSLYYTGECDDGLKKGDYANVIIGHIHGPPWGEPATGHA